MSQNALKPFGVRPHMPSRIMTSKSEMIEFAKANADPGSHPAGTCKMGLDEWAVVDPQLRVHGIDRLRVCDASVMPRLISTNTNATAIMIGERCAHFIKGHAA